jgi:hypothetical protein
MTTVGSAGGGSALGLYGFLGTHPQLLLAPCRKLHPFRTLSVPHVLRQGNSPGNHPWRHAPVPPVVKSSAGSNQFQSMAWLVTLLFRRGAQLFAPETPR